MRTQTVLEGGLRLALIGALHLLAIGTMATGASRVQPEALVSRLDVRVIEERPRAVPAKAAPKPIAAPAKPAPGQVPAPELVRAAAPPDLMSAAAEAPAPESVAVAPQPAVPAGARAETVAAPPAAPPPPARAAAPSVTTPPRFDAAYLHNPAPAYPRASRLAGQQGQTVLKVLVNGQGAAARIEVQRSSGFQRLDQAALEAVSQWRFVPAKRGAEAIEDWVLVPIAFRLDA